MNFLNLKLKDQPDVQTWIHSLNSEYLIVFAFILFTLKQSLIEKWTDFGFAKWRNMSEVLLTKLNCLFHMHSFLLVNSVTNHK